MYSSTVTKSSLLSISCVSWMLGFFNIELYCCEYCIVVSMYYVCVSCLSPEQTRQQKRKNDICTRRYCVNFVFLAINIDRSNIGKSTVWNENVEVDRWNWQLIKSGFYYFTREQSIRVSSTIEKFKFVNALMVRNHWFLSVQFKTKSGKTISLCTTLYTLFISIDRSFLVLLLRMFMIF